MTNEKELKKANCGSSKNPKLFGIDIHVDDSEGVRMEGEKYGFKTIIIQPADEKWVDKILERIKIEEMKLKATKSVI